MNGMATKESLPSGEHSKGNKSGSGSNGGTINANGSRRWEVEGGKSRWRGQLAGQTESGEKEVEGRGSLAHGERVVVAE